MISLRDLINAAQSKKTAIGHFNASNLDGIWAIADAALELKAPVIVGLSEGERDFVGVRQAAAIIKSIREERGQEIFLNADHTYSFERVKEAVDAGFDSVIFDGAKSPLDENIETTKKCVEYARKSGRDVLLEGELGYIGSSSEVLEAVPNGAIHKDEDMTPPEDAARFVKESGVDLLAPAVGNIHGFVRGGNPALNIKRIGEIASAAAIPLVLHGASGNTADEIVKAVKAGAVIVHVSTELRMAYRTGLMKSLTENMEEVAPYKYLKPAKLAMQKVVGEKIMIIYKS